MESWVKYPRTFHLPSSPGLQSDDKVAHDLSAFAGKEVVITEKMDGENTSLYRDGFHARSLDSKFHPSRSWLAGFHAQVAHSIPEGWRVCSKNMYARHSVCYENLASYFLVFSFNDFSRSVVKWVRAGHVQSDQHWSKQPMQANQLAKECNAL